MLCEHLLLQAIHFFMRYFFLYLHATSSNATSLNVF